MATFVGTPGQDFFSAVIGNDDYDLLGDFDTIFYDSGLFVNGVFINNTNAAIDGVPAFTVDKRGFGMDSITNVESFHGSNADDVIYVGGLGGTYTFDRAGDDIVVASQDPNASDDHYFAAGSGDDTYIGTVNGDRVDYSDEGFDGSGPIFQGVDADLAAGTAARRAR